MKLEDYGWSDALQIDFAPFAALGLTPARVTAHHRALWRLATSDGELGGRMSGRFALEAGPGEHPTVGDWLAVSRVGESDDAIIHALLPRRSVFTRRGAGDVGVQVVAANVDVAFLVAAMNADLNVRRLERYLVATRDSGATPVIVLTKADLSEDREAAAAAVEAVAGGAPVVIVSAKQGEGMDVFDAWLKPGVTAALLGSSGAGKSTLLNALAGRALMDTGAVREGDDRGRHTTTHRELFQLPGGALLVDTPGMRELGLLDVEEALDVSFDDVTSLFGECRFNDCSHGTEPGCAVLAALADGSLREDRWSAYLKLQKELEFVATREDPAAAFAKRQKWKQIHKAQRAKYRHRDRNEDR
jgi:ribosome biogenesis GTPase / thiamine phosphate phosphatase